MKKLTYLLLVILPQVSLGCLKQKQTTVNQFNQKNMGKVLIVIAPSDFKDEEYFTPKQILENNGFTVETASTVNQPTSVKGEVATAEVLLSNAQVNDYEAVVFVGGPGAQVYFNDATAQNLAKAFYQAGKVVSAICIAPTILANAGLLIGKQATVFPSQAETLKANGADYTGAAVTVDGKIVTGKDPAAADEFGEKVVELLKQ